VAKAAGADHYLASSEAEAMAGAQKTLGESRHHLRLKKQLNVDGRVVFLRRRLFKTPHALRYPHHSPSHGDAWRPDVADEASGVGLVLHVTDVDG